MEREGTATTRPLAQSFIIKRPRLTKLLDESEARIILLVAPAGYGKTTLAREWLSGREDVVWYSGRPAMADVAALASGLVTAFATNDEARDRAIERIRILATRGQSPEALTKAVLSAVSPTASILVIDDCHLAASPESEALLTALTIDTRLRVVLLSRSRPTWVTSRMSVYGEAQMLEMSDLAFTNEEALCVLPQDARLDHSPTLAEARGWPAVIGLAAISGGRLGVHGARHPDDLYEFFAEDIFRGAHEELKEALFLLALGAAADPNVAEDILGSAYRDLVADGIEQGFLARDLGGALTIHPLLEAFLLKKLGESPDEVVETAVTRVIASLRSHGRWDECLVALQCFPLENLIVSVLGEALGELLTLGRVNALKSWLDVATRSGITDPILLVAEAELALRDGDTARAQALGERGGALVGRGDMAARSHLTAARAAHLREDAAAIVWNCDRANALTSSSAIRFDSLLLALLHAIEARTQDIDPLFESLAAVPISGPDQAFRVATAQVLILLEGGRIQEASRACELAVALMAHARDPLARTNFLNMLGYLSVAQGRYEKALEVAESHFEEAKQSGLEFAVDYALIGRVSALTGLRRFSLAQRTLDELQRRGNATHGNIAAFKAINATRLKIGLGDLRGARVLAQTQIAGSTPRGLVGELASYRGLISASLGDGAAAKTALDEAATYAHYFEVDAFQTLAQAVLNLQGRGQQHHAATASLAKVIDVGHLDAVVLACRAYPALAVAGALDPAVKDSLTSILTGSRDFALGRSIGLQMPRELRRSETLSPREREVHELLTQGRSNREIAKTLFISESTVKVHVRHILEKLGVHTRTEAALTPIDGI